MSDSLWLKVIKFINLKEDKIITRKELLGIQDREVNTIDNYRNILKNCGYLTKIKRGIYKVNCKIPEDLTKNYYEKNINKQVVNRLFHDMNIVNEMEKNNDNCSRL